MLCPIVNTNTHLIWDFLYFKHTDIAKSTNLVNTGPKTNILSKFKIKPDFGVKFRFEARCLHILIKTLIVWIENINSKSKFLKYSNLKRENTILDTKLLH